MKAKEIIEPIEMANVVVPGLTTIVSTHGTHISNPGGGDCGVYAVMNAMWGKNYTDSMQAPIIRGQIADVMKGFLELYKYRENILAKKVEQDNDTIVDLYKNIFKDFAVFKFAAQEKLRAPLSDDTDSNTRKSLESTIVFLESSDWEGLKSNSAAIDQIYRTCNLFDIDVVAAIEDHGKLSSECTVEEYHQLVLKQGEWLDNHELAGYLLTMGYVQTVADDVSGTTICFKNSDGIIIGLHNNSRDVDANFVGQALGIHWQAVSFREGDNFVSLAQNTRSSVEASRLPVDIGTTETIANISNSDSQLDRVKNTSDALGHLKDSQVEGDDKIREIKEAYNVALEYYKAGKYEEAERDFVKVIRPVLAKNEMKHLYVTVEDVKLETLDAMYHIGLIIQNIKGSDGNYRYENNFAKAAAIFQYCAEFVKKHEIEHEADFVELAFLTECSLLQDLGTDSQLNVTEYLEKIDGYKNKLKLARESVKVGLDSVKDLTVANISTRAARVEEIYRDSVEVFVSHSPEGNGLLQNLLSDCQSQLPSKPEGLEYAVIGLGSISIGTMTPWSDIEFAILINKASTKNEQEIYREYCRNLTKLLHTKIINLGETALRSVGIEILNNFKTSNKSDDWFWDDVMSSGVSFDGAHWHACKTPFGRKGYEEKPDYELIMTPQEMSKFQDRDGVKSQTLEERDWFSTDKHLVQALKSVALIDGSQSLLDEYRDLSRANEVDTRERALEILQEDITKFSLKLGNDEEGKLIDVKKAIYRLGDRVVVSLANYYQITAEKGQTHINLWQIIDLMQKNQKLDLQGAINLKQAVSIATELRLSTYLNNQGQSEGMSTYEPAVEHLDEAQRQELREKTFYIKDTAILHHFYYVMLRVQNIVGGFCDEKSQERAELVLKTDDLYDNSNYHKGMVHARFLEYDQALHYMESAKVEHLGDLEFLYNLFSLCNTTAKIVDNISIARNILALTQSKYQNNSNHPDIANSYNNLGVAYDSKGEYDLAITQHKTALKIRCEAYKSSPNHPDIANSYNNLGSAYDNKGEYDLAIAHYKTALKIRCEAYKSSPNHSHIADSYNNLGSAYDNKGEYDLAITQHKTALKIRCEAYKSSPNHPDIAASYNNLGAVYDSKGEYDTAIAHYKTALKIVLVIYKSNLNHPDIATSYNNLGNAYKSKGEYDTAIERHTKALKIRCEAYKSSPNHPDIATSHNNLGNVYYNKGEYDTAIERHTKALKIRCEAYKSNPNHPDIATSYNNLGNAYKSKGEYDTAIERHTKALKIRLEAYKSNPNHPSIANSYNNLGNVYESKGEYDLAIDYHKQALEIRLKAYKSNPNHPDIANSYNNLGNAYKSKGEYDQAIEQYKKALEIKLEAYKSNPNHPNIVSSYNNLGNAYESKGEYDLAIEQYMKALKIRLEAYKSNPNHPDIATIHNNLGNVYYNKGEYDLAIKQHKKALEIRLEAHKSSPNHPDIANSYNNLGAAYNSKGEYDLAYNNSCNALAIFSEYSNREYIDISKRVLDGILLQLGNIALLKDNTDSARKYYEQIDQNLAQVDFNSEEFFKLQLEHANIAYETNSLISAKNCQLVLLKIDPELQYGNHYHNLACFYTCLGIMEEANIAFTNALNHPKVTGGLHAEYAQFLILNKDNNTLPNVTHLISEHLYSAINSDDVDSLQYGKIEQNSISSILGDFIKQKQATIEIDPKILAYYLLIKHPEYRKGSDNTDGLLESFQKYCDEYLQDEISFMLLEDVYKLVNKMELANACYIQAEFIRKIDDTIMGKKLDNTNDDAIDLNPQDIRDYVSKLEIIAQIAISDERLDKSIQTYSRMHAISTKILEEESNQLQCIVNNLATMYLLTNDINQYTALKMQGAELNNDLIILAGKDVNSILAIEQGITIQLQMLIRQQVVDGTQVTTTNDIASDYSDVYITGDVDKADSTE